MGQLISKWGEVCREVFMELYNHSAREVPDLTIGQLIRHLNVEPGTLGFSADDVDNSGDY